MISVTDNSPQQINAALLALSKSSSVDSSNTAKSIAADTSSKMKSIAADAVKQSNINLQTVQSNLDSRIKNMNTRIGELSNDISDLQYVTGHLTEVSSATPTFTFYSRDQNPDSTGTHYYATGWIASYNISPHYPTGYTGETTIDLYTQFYPHSQWGYEIFLVITENHPINGFRTFTEGLTAWQYRESLEWLYIDSGITTVLDTFAINQYWNDKSWADSISSSGSRFHMNKVGLNLSTHFNYGNGNRVFFANIIKVDKGLTTNIEVPRSYEPSQLILDIRRGYYNYH